MDTIQEFKQKGYVHLNNFLDEESCRQLVIEFNKLIDQKRTVKDPQCPSSESIHGTPLFDKLLEDLCPHFEQKLGLKLFPTYSYARLYNTENETLEIHRDRPACEISATLTLGFEGDVWPIYMGVNEDKSNATEIRMQIGDAVMYRGCDIYHWREPYKKGKWQAQVFLHYVDQNGPYAEWKYDKRKYLSHQDTSLNTISDYYVLDDALSNDFCDKLIEVYTKKEIAKLAPEIGNDAEARVDLDIRNVQRVDLNNHKGIGATLTAIGINLNHEFYKFDITHSHQVEFLMYEPEGRYVAHVDSFRTRSLDSRKLTCIAILNDDFEGGRFYIQTAHVREYPRQKKGTVIVFPSYQLHGVEDVIKGNRYSVVTWLLGPPFK